MTDGWDPKKRRLPNWDYSNPGTYFLTFVTHERRLLFGRVVDCPENPMFEAYISYTPLGEQCMKAIDATFKSFDMVKLDSFIVMPNHVHLLVTVHGNLSGKERNTETIPKIVANIKRIVTHEARKTTPHAKIWQRSFHDHIVRSEDDYKRIWEYIVNNPSKWAMDKYHF